MKNKNLIVGGNSFVGRHLFSTLKSNSNFVTYYTSRQKSDANSIYLDLLDCKNFADLINEYKIDSVLWVAAIKDVKWCEANKDLAKQLNLDSLITSHTQLNRMTKKPKFFFLSSDYVFDGNTGLYDVHSKTMPNTYYGQLKLAAESYLLAQNQKDVIIRTAALFGKNGVFFNWIIDSLQKSNNMSLFKNSYFTPTSINYLCKVIVDLIVDSEEIKSNQLYHICGSERLSRYELAKNLKDNFKTLFKAELTAEDCTNYLKHDMSIKPSYYGKQGPHSFNHLAEEVAACIKL